GLGRSAAFSPALPLANTTSPPRSMTNSRYASAISTVTAGSFQYSPPQELLMIVAPASASSALTAAKNSPMPSPAWTSLPWPEPSSVGGVSLMIRDDTTLAQGATPPGHCPNGLPAASWATVVPWPTLSSTERSFPFASMWTKFCSTRPASAGWLRLMPVSRKPIVTPAPGRSRPRLPAWISVRWSYIPGCDEPPPPPPPPPPDGGGSGVSERTLPPPPQAARASATASG